jgi:hypothetical protein
MLAKAYGGEAMKKFKVFLSGINDSKRIARMWKITEEVDVQDLTEPMKIVKKCGIWCIQIDFQALEL